MKRNQSRKREASVQPVEEEEVVAKTERKAAVAREKKDHKVRREFKRIVEMPELARASLERKDQKESLEVD